MFLQNQIPVGTIHAEMEACVLTPWAWGWTWAHTPASASMDTWAITARSVCYYVL